jgi:ribosomal protein S12 methylthiotransferase accessory factor
MNEVNVKLLDGMKLEAQINGYKILTDQPCEKGGKGHAPNPVEYFLTSTALCAGFYVKAFCQRRGIDTTKVSLTQTVKHDEKNKLKIYVTNKINLPEDFPTEYKEPLKKSAEKCLVKNMIITGPEFSIEV